MKEQITKYVGLPVLAFFEVSCVGKEGNFCWSTYDVEEAAEKIIDEIEGEEDAQAELNNSKQHSFFHTKVPFNVFGIPSVHAD